jgi:hypothetical protein
MLFSKEKGNRMESQPWNARTIVSTEISDTEWEKLFSVTPENKKYLLRTLRVSKNAPVEWNVFCEAKQASLVDSGVKKVSRADIFQDINGLKAIFRQRKLSFAIRVTEGIYSRNSKYQMCKVKPKALQQ